MHVADLVWSSRCRTGGTGRSPGVARWRAGLTAEKFVLLSFNFAGAYDTIDHRMLRMNLLRLRLPRCLVD